MTEHDPLADPRTTAVPMVAEYGREGYRTALAHYVIPGEPGRRKSLCGRREAVGAIGRVVWVPAGTGRDAPREHCRRCTDIFLAAKRAAEIDALEGIETAPPPRMLFFPGRRPNSPQSPNSPPETP